MNPDQQQPTNLEEVLDRIGKAESEGNKVSLGSILHKIEDRSFGSLLLLWGLIAFSPIIGDIPGMSSLMGIFVLLTVGLVMPVMELVPFSAISLVSS